MIAQLIVKKAILFRIMWIHRPLATWCIIDLRPRAIWPSAPLEFQADEGEAVGLFLADLLRRTVPPRLIAGYGIS
jgi:hypothetical protein